jgi:hypothetical protein
MHISPVAGSLFHDEKEHAAVDAEEAPKCARAKSLVFASRVFAALLLYEQFRLARLPTSALANNPHDSQNALNMDRCAEPRALAVRWAPRLQLCKPRLVQ